MEWDIEMEGVDLPPSTLITNSKFVCYHLSLEAKSSLYVSCK